MTTEIRHEVEQNLRFLIAEVVTRLMALQCYLEQDASSCHDSIFDSGGHIHNLRSRVLEGCHRLTRESTIKGYHPAWVRAVETSAGELERIAAAVHDTTLIMGKLHPTPVPGRKRLRQMLRPIMRGVDVLDRALQRLDTTDVLRIGESKQRVDRQGARLTHKLIRQLQRHREPIPRVRALELIQQIRIMGDALLTISESLVTACLGVSLTVDRLHALQSTVDQVHHKPLSQLEILPLAQTRSGSGISAIHDHQNQEHYLTIYKDGSRRKLQQEHAGIRLWHQVAPGIAPEVISFHKQGRSASMLIEHLPGETLEQILLHQSGKRMQQALRQLTRTLKGIWKKSRETPGTTTTHMAQLRQRLQPVYTIHPRFQRSHYRIGREKIVAFERLLDRAEQIEQQLTPPFSVFIHGDFNLDNILFDRVSGKIHFIDLRRSRQADYTQDISVLMISCYRLQRLDQPQRLHSLDLAKTFYYFAHDFAKRHGDTGFQLRLALGLARSFATSTRFILDPVLAWQMFSRAHYLLERIIETPPDNSQSFQLTIEELFHV